MSADLFHVLTDKGLDFYVLVGNYVPGLDNAMEHLARHVPKGHALHSVTLIVRHDYQPFSYRVNREDAERMGI